MEMNQEQRLIAAVQGFTSLTAALRDPKSGCPWDLEQTPSSLAPFIIDEAYELAHAITTPEYENHFLDELADVLFGIAMQAQIASEHKSFDLIDVFTHATKKFTRRHPHVFGSPEQRRKRDMDSLWATWKKVKQEEQARRIPIPQAFPTSMMDSKICSTGPALRQADKIGQKMASIKWDWDRPQEVLDHLKSEIQELEETLHHQQEAEMMDELGDTFFTLAQLCRFVGQCPEQAAHHGNQKFIRRFRQVEQLAQERNIPLTDPTAVEALWQECKAQEKRG
ncbi:MAG: nucleoside triphosphate pyrophosphohydrolase [Zetaproteobacteria bacterium]|nr:nucleoside triphosphate pyrophosphohydrolase [Zetaproteobacteria bacterium]